MTDPIPSTHTVEVTGLELTEAYAKWQEYHDKIDQPTSKVAFMDYIDPVRQAGFRLNNDRVIVPNQVAKRIEQLNSPHWFALMKANADRIEHAHVSWGKKYIRRSGSK